MIHTTFASESETVRETRTPVRLPDALAGRALPWLGPEILEKGASRCPPF